jgi:hypothetical protein
LNEIRLYKVLNYARLRLTLPRDSRRLKILKNADYVWGGPESVAWPPEEWVPSFAKENQAAFVEMWKCDVGIILEAARRHGARPILMTYPIRPLRLPAEEIASKAMEEDVLLVRNDTVFSEALETMPADDLLMHDRWHPSAMGYRLIAEAVFGAIEDNGLIVSDAPLPPGRD